LGSFGIINGVARGLQLAASAVGVTIALTVARYIVIGVSLAAGIGALSYGVYQHNSFLTTLGSSLLMVLGISFAVKAIYALAPLVAKIGGGIVNVAAWMGKGIVNVAAWMGKGIVNVAAWMGKGITAMRVSGWIATVATKTGGVIASIAVKVWNVAREGGHIIAYLARGAYCGLSVAATWTTGNIVSLARTAAGLIPSAVRTVTGGIVSVAALAGRLIAYLARGA
jgi:hypothetical protein